MRFLSGLLLIMALSPLVNAGPKTGPAYTEEPFGTLADGTKITAYTLANTNGAWAKIITYGGIVTELHVPDQNGQFDDIVLGFDNLKGYLAGHPYFGCITGRVANRVRNAQFTLDGKTYKVGATNGEHSLHGGISGFDKKVWKAEPMLTADGPALKLSYTSRDKEEGYPGNLQCVVTYTMTADNALRIDYHATTDKPTPVNLTNHSYFNLAGHHAGSIGEHILQLAAEQFTASDELLLPTGKIVSVANTPFDFRQPTAVGKRLQEAGGKPVGYDLNYVTGMQPTPQPRHVATLSEPKTGRILKVLTTEPGVQLYTGNFLDGTITGKGGAVYKQHTAICLETQHFPDSANRPEFPSIILRPGETYRQTTIYQFSTAKK